MKIRYAHTNIIARNWEKLANFYIKVFDCKLKPPGRNQSGFWLEKGTGVKNAALKGMHLILPGNDAEGPTLEIYQYEEIIDTPKPRPNSKGIGHLAFEVDNVYDILEKALEYGAKKIGEISEDTVEGVGKIQFIYIYDPEDNIIELQSWD
ncbi:MAG: VOC family protein [Roseivirga sp.]|nr:VOC family protein [Roseivirga sp.]